MSMNSRLFERAEAISHHIREYWAARRAMQARVGSGSCAAQSIEPLESRTMLSLAPMAAPVMPAVVVQSPVSAALTPALAADQVVSFPDPGLESAVRDTLGKPDGDITVADMQSLTSLGASYQGITDLAGLEFATNLTELNLGDNQISDLAPLAGLTQLTGLYLWSNQISDLTPLAGLTQLTNLNLGSNQISDLAPLAGLTQLTNLSLGGNQIGDLAPLAGLTQLTDLYLIDNQVGDVAPLAGLTQLTNLSLWGNQVSGLAPLAGLTQLTNLSLGGNQVSDIAPLAGLRQLTYLYLSDNRVGDVAPLAGLTQLSGLYLWGNQINDISSLAGMTQLSVLDLSGNYLDISDGSPAMTVIHGLQDQGTGVTYDPQQEQLPSDIVLSASAIAENQPAGTLIGTLALSDPGAGTGLTYSLVSGTGSADNARFTIVGNELRSTAGFDYEARSSYSVRVRTVAQDGRWREKVLAISITNVNEAPTNLVLSNSSIAENQPAGTVVGTFAPTDPDTGNSFTYSLVSGTGAADNASFTINGNQLMAATSFDYEAKQSYSIRVRVTDQGGLWYEKVLAIVVTNGNEVPTSLALSATSVAENQPAGTVVGTLSASDPDAGGSFTYSLVSGAGSADNAGFTINGSQLRTSRGFDYEAKTTCFVRIRVTDSGGLSYEEPFAITVTDDPTDLRGQFGLVGGKTVASPALLDADGDLVTFKLSGGGTGRVYGFGRGFEEIMLSGTGPKSVLSISVKKGPSGDGLVTIGGIASDGLLKGISASKAVVSGDVLLNTQMGPAGTSTLALRLAGMQDGAINTHGLPISSLKLQIWQDGDATPGRLIAPWIGAISASGDWQADILTSAANRGLALGSLKVGGSLSGATLWAAGSVKSIAVRGAIRDSRIAAFGDLGSLSAAELQSSNVLVGVSQGFAGPFATGPADFANPAARLGKLTIAGRKLPKGQVHPAYVTSSQISAGTYGTVTLTNVPASAQPLLHVFTDTGTLKIKSLSSGMVAAGTWKGGVAAKPGQLPRPDLVEQVG